MAQRLNARWNGCALLVPEAYGFKSIKWLSHLVLTNLPYVNDTYAEQGNDVDSPLKTFAATLCVPAGMIAAGQALPLSGYGEVGLGGIVKGTDLDSSAVGKSARGRSSLTAPWTDMEILPTPKQWGGELSDAPIPSPTYGFDANGVPLQWPMRLTCAHWAGTHPGLPAGKYTLRCRAIDWKGHAQPMPAGPFRKSGHSAIEQLSLVVD